MRFVALEREVKGVNWEGKDGLLREEAAHVLACVSDERSRSGGRNLLYGSAHGDFIFAGGGFEFYQKFAGGFSAGDGWDDSF